MTLWQNCGKIGVYVRFVANFYHSVSTIIPQVVEKSKGRERTFMRIALELPVYKAYSGRLREEFQYVRISDVKDEGLRKRFNRFMFGQACPLIQLPNSYLIDAVFYWDYERFIRVINREEINP